MTGRRSLLICVAVAFAVGGGTAGAAQLIHTANIAKGAVTLNRLSPEVQKMVRSHAVNGTNGAQGAQGPQGPAGPQGAPGEKGAQGAAGSNGPVSGVVVWTGSYAGGSGLGQTITATASCGDDISTYGKTLIGGGGTVTSSGTARGALTASWPSTPTVPGLPTNQISGIWTVSGIVTATGTGTVTAQAYAICA
jgi:hypothetical protein